MNSLKTLMVAVAVAIAAPDGSAGWVAVQSWTEVADVAPAMKVKCTGNGYGQGNAHCSANAKQAELFAEAVDASTGCDITAAIQGTATGWASYAFLPEGQSDKGRVRVTAQMQASGTLNISDGPASAILFARSRFYSTSVAPIESKAEGGKTTQTSYTIDVPIPEVGTSIPVTGTTHTGSWPIKGGTEVVDMKTDCIDFFTYVHRIDVYGDAWADGGWFGLDLAGADVVGRAKLSSTLEFKRCPAPMEDPPGDHPSSPPPSGEPGPPAKPGTGGGPSYPTTGGSGPATPRLPS